MSAYTKDILRTIRKHLKRLLALIAITTLGLTAFVGINAACKDMYMGADAFYDKQQLFDIRVQSTLGLTDDDIDALSKIDQVEKVVGGYSEQVNISEKEQNHTADVEILSDKKVNEPYVLEGELPSKRGQVAVTQKYLDDTGKTLGDSLAIEEVVSQESDEEKDAGKETDSLLEEEEARTFTTTTFTITALVIDPMDTASTEGTAAFRSSSTADYSLFVTKANVDIEVYSSIYITLQGVSGLDCYSKEYEDTVNQTVSYIESSIMDRREEARYDEIVKEATDSIVEAESAMNEELESAQQEIDSARAKLEESKTQLIAGSTYSDEALDMFTGMREELAFAEKELSENEQTLLEEKQEAERLVSVAYAELDTIEKAQWYVQDRASLDSYSSLDSDISSIRSIGTAFPILFLVVAILISLTTMTRMVEEERGLIGTYKALGFSSRAISRKYLVYAGIASLAGSLIGCIIGFFALPNILLEILKVIYTIPNVPLFFDFWYGLAGSLLFVVSILAATAFACASELKETPAALMRPKAPRQGARIFLERIPFIWNHLKFLNKVAARNLFRYKKRFFMTLIGIAGCTALVLAGFAIKDSVTAMKPKQYGEIYTYDMMVVANPDDDTKLVEYLQNDSDVKDYLSVETDSIKVLNTEGDSEPVQMTVIPKGASLDSYIQLIDTQGNEVVPGNKGVFLTQNAAELLKIDEGEDLTIQTLQLERATVTTSTVVKNYLGNNLFITEELYEEVLEEYEPNSAYAHLAESAGDPIAYAESMLDKDFVLSSVSTAGLEEQFSNDFVVLNYVIYLLVILAAGLAFVVLFTLSSTNISERIRELATIKVLGFFDKEVHSYVNKETLALTLISVLCGLPLGYFLSWLLLAALKMPSIYFELTIEPFSYVLAAIISFSFTFIVNLMTNRVLDNVDMVEALKSVE